MKRAGKPMRREVFVLTPDEKRAAACVIGAFLLGLATMQYRARHPRTPPAPTAQEQREAKRAVSRNRTARNTPAPRAAAAKTDQDADRTHEPADDE